MKRLAISILFAVASAVGAQAQEGLGEAEYMAACAGCHGATAEGNGPLAAFLTVDVPRLTRLAADNGGVFPVTETLRIIDGRAMIKGHGGPMPIWGDRFTADARALGGPVDPAMIARGRILSLVYYLEEIQD